MEKLNILKVNEGNYFGTSNFLLNSNYEETAECIKFCQILFISRDKFMNLIKNYPKDYEKFCDYKDS